MTYSYDPTQIRARGKDQMRFELGDTQTEGGADTCALADEEYEAVLAGLKPGKNMTKFTLEDSFPGIFCGHGFTLHVSSGDDSSQCLINSSQGMPSSQSSQINGISCEDISSMVIFFMTSNLDLGAGMRIRCSEPHVLSDM